MQPEGSGWVGNVNEFQVNIGLRQGSDIVRSILSECITREFNVRQEERAIMQENYCLYLGEMFY